MLVELKRTENTFGRTLTLFLEGTEKVVFSTLDDGFGVWRIENFVAAAGRMNLVTAYEGCSLKIIPKKFAS